LFLTLFFKCSILVEHRWMGYGRDPNNRPLGWRAKEQVGYRAQRLREAGEGRARWPILYRTPQTPCKGLEAAQGRQLHRPSSDMSEAIRRTGSICNLRRNSSHSAACKQATNSPFSSAALAISLGHRSNTSANKKPLHGRARPGQPEQPPQPSDLDGRLKERPWRMQYAV
jgi:hypothetical protein